MFVFFSARTQARDPSRVRSSQSVRCKNKGEPLVHGCHCHGFGVTCLGYLDQLPYKVFVCVTPIESGVTRFNGLPFADVLEKVKLRACLPELLPRHCRFRRKLAEQNTKTQTKPRQLNFRMVRKELALMVQDNRQRASLRSSRWSRARPTAKGTRCRAAAALLLSFGQPPVVRKRSTVNFPCNFDVVLLCL